MEIGVGLDTRLKLTHAELRDLAREAVTLGYESAWTTSNVYEDAFHTCIQWSLCTSDLVEGGIKTGIGVVPVPLWTPISLGIVSGTLSKATGGRFTLGVGSGNIRSPSYRRALGLDESGPISLVRDYLNVLRQMLGGRGGGVRRPGTSDARRPTGYPGAARSPLRRGTRVRRCCA